jgi:hypothetical protein
MGQKKAEPGDLLRDTLDMLILKTLNRGQMSHGCIPQCHSRAARK